MGAAMRQRGYSIVEALVALSILSVVMVGFLTMFDTSAKISKVQTAISGAQENLRYVQGYIVRYARMAGSGGIPVVNPASPYAPEAVIVTDNVAAGTTAPGPSAGVTLDLVPGTDILEMWGTFTSPMFDVSAGSYTFGAGPGAGTFTVPATSAITGQAQDVSGVVAAITAGEAVPALLVSVQRNMLKLDNNRERILASYGAAVLTAASPGTQFSFASSGYSSTIEGFNPNGAYPAGLSDVLRVSIINGVRFFVAYEPATGVPTLYFRSLLAGVTQPVANDIVDLQVALGCDRNVDGQIQEDRSGPGLDEWLFNNQRGTGAEANTDKFLGTDLVPLVAYLTQMRVTVVARASAPDPGFIQPPIFNEDGRDILADAPYLGMQATSFRYRSLTEHVKLRGLGPIL